MTRGGLWFTAVVILGCAHHQAARDPDAELAARVPRECAADSTCAALEAEAAARLNACRSGLHECPRAWRNLADVRSAREALRAEAAADVVTPPLMSQTEGSFEREARLQQERAEAEAQRREDREEEMAAAGPAERERRVRACLEAQHLGTCAETIDIAVAVATPDEAETLRSIVKAAFEGRVTVSAAGKSPAGASAPGDSPRSLLCCDGTASPSCSCEGSHRGCCSHHRGVCGCE